MCSINWIAISALATTAMVIISFVVFVRPTFRRPKFSIDFSLGLPFCRRTTSTDFTRINLRTETYWIRLRIRNTGKSVARNCLGKIIKITDDKGQENDEFDVMHLHWVGTSWIDSPFESLDLDRGEFAYLDILVTQSGNDAMYIAGDQFPWTKYERRQILDRLPPGKYILSISVYGDDASPETKYVSLIWSGSIIRDVNMEIHDTIGKAKSWLKKAEKASMLKQAELDTDEHTPKKVSLGQYITSQIPTYFILGLILIYVSFLSEHILCKFLFIFLATITLLWIFALWKVAFNWKFPKKLEKIEVITKFMERYNEVFYAFASPLVLAAGFVKTFADLKTVGINTPFSLSLYALWLILVILSIVFAFRSRRQQGHGMKTI
ncbi:hypothetical protein ACFLTN_07395 [Chloroflexota bacterium]